MYYVLRGICGKSGLSNSNQLSGTAPAVHKTYAVLARFISSGSVAHSIMKLNVSSRSLNRFLDSKMLAALESYSHFHPSPLTLQQFLDFGQSATERDSFTFLKKELPLRLAIITKEMDLLPPALLQTPTLLFLQVVRHKYSALTTLIRMFTARAFKTWLSLTTAVLHKPLSTAFARP